MRRLVSVAVFLSIFAFVPLAAQDDGPNVVRIYYFKTLPGKAAAYYARLQEFGVPRFDELVRRGILVSYQFLVQDAGAGEYTNVNILEYANWDAANDNTRSVVDDACRAVFGGMTYEEKTSEMAQKYGSLSTLRTLIRREVYTSAKP